MNSSDYTNFLGIWKDINFDKTKNIFYKVNHGDASWEKLFELLTFQTVDKIFVLDQESQSHKHIERDSRIQAWDSTVSGHPRIHTYLFWFDWVREVEESMQLTKKILPANKKQSPVLFDSLLGTLDGRPHKQFVLENIQSHKQNKFITGACAPHCNNIFPDTYIHGGSYETGKSTAVFNKHGQTATVSCFLPYEIYNRSWYSLVCETRGTGSDLFFTEKLAKPLISSRIFVLFGQYKQLHHLKQLGFKTFDNIIDESYDLESDDVLRYTKAWNQVEFLMKQDPVAIYEKCSSILEHNRYVMKTTNWYDILLKSMYEKANNVV